MFRVLHKSWEILVNPDDLLFPHASSSLPEPLAQGKPLVISSVNVSGVPQVASPSRTHAVARSGPSTFHSDHSRARPATIAELAAQARENLWDPSKDLRHLLHAAESSRCTAETRLLSKDYEGAFVEFAKAATLVLEKIPTHKEYRTLLKTDQRHNLSMVSPSESSVTLFIRSSECSLPLLPGLPQPQNAGHGASEAAD